jgi:hypothetical protein
MELRELINNITPYYNKYKVDQSQISGMEALELNWDVGNLLKGYLDDHKVAPHALYRQIYGKSEQKTNTTQNSYITREFLSRAYRIRNIFNSKMEIKEVFPALKNYNLFREAMPFFDNPKYKLDGNKKSDLINILNSKKTNKEIIIYIERLQKEMIGIRNPRTQRLQELSKQKILFIELYNYLYKKIQNVDYKDAVESIGSADQRFISDLSKNTGALASDQLSIKVFDIPGDIQNPWKDYAEMINKLAEKEDASVRRRFRRLIPPEKMMRMSEMIYAMRSENDFNKFRL